MRPRVDSHRTIAWIFAKTSGIYHSELICESLGNATVGEWGENCGSVCGFCLGFSNCAAPGFAAFNGGAWARTGNCGSDGLGELVCGEMTWTCVN